MQKVVIPKSPKELKNFHKALHLKEYKNQSGLKKMKEHYTHALSRDARTRANLVSEQKDSAGFLKNTATAFTQIEEINPLPVYVKPLTIATDSEMAEVIQRYQAKQEERKRVLATPKHEIETSSTTTTTTTTCLEETASSKEKAKPKVVPKKLLLHLPPYSEIKKKSKAELESTTAVNKSHPVLSEMVGTPRRITCLENQGIVYGLYVIPCRLSFDDFKSANTQQVVLKSPPGSSFAFLKRLNQGDHKPKKTVNQKGPYSTMTLLAKRLKQCKRLKAMCCALLEIPLLQLTSFHVFAPLMKALKHEKDVWRLVMISAESTCDLYPNSICQGLFQTFPFAPTIFHGQVLCLAANSSLTSFKQLPLSFLDQYLTTIADGKPNLLPNLVLQSDFCSVPQVHAHETTCLHQKDFLAVTDHKQGTEMNQSSPLDDTRSLIPKIRSAWAESDKHILQQYSLSVEVPKVKMAEEVSNVWSVSETFRSQPTVSVEKPEQPLENSWPLSVAKPVQQVVEPSWSLFSSFLSSDNGKKDYQSSSGSYFGRQESPPPFEETEPPISVRQPFPGLKPQSLASLHQHGIETLEDLKVWADEWETLETLLSLPNATERLRLRKFLR